MSGTGAVARAQRWYADDPVVSEYAKWLSGFGLCTYVTLTYRDAFWDSKAGFSSTRRISAGSVLRDFRWFLRHSGYTGRYFISVEQTDRTIPHIHGLLDGCNWSALAKSWISTRGGCRILPVHDGCASYVSKYVLKDSDGTGLDFRLE